MKVFIIFFAILILNISLLCYNSDMNRYMKVQAHLKACAEECAAGAALFLDAEAYSRGILVVDETSAHAYIDFMIKKSMENSAAYKGGAISASMVLMDDARGYEEANYYKINRRCPAVVVSLRYEGPDIFRLPFLCVESLERTATYQWEDGLTSSF